MVFCQICLSNLSRETSNENSGFCSVCKQALKNQGSMFESGSSLFIYTGVVRDLVLRIKVGGEQSLLRALINFGLSHPLTLAELSLCDEIMPVPSSFWGRLRGSIDLAYFFACECAYLSGKPLRMAPLAYHWRFFKRSRQKNRLAMQLNFPIRRDSIRTLLIDDVITTGFSLLKLAFKLEESQCRFLTLSDAYSTRE